MAFPIDLGSILDALGSIFGAPEGDFLRFFCALSLDWTDSLEDAATKEKPTKIAKSTCHVSPSQDKRPEICAIFDLKRKNPGTFVLIRRKVASRLYTKL